MLYIVISAKCVTFFMKYTDCNVFVIFGITFSSSTKLVVFLQEHTFDLCGNHGIIKLLREG